MKIMARYDYSSRHQQPNFSMEMNPAARKKIALALHVGEINLERALGERIMRSKHRSGVGIKLFATEEFRPNEPMHVWGEAIDPTGKNNGVFLGGATFGMGTTVDEFRYFIASICCNAPLFR